MLKRLSSKFKKSKDKGKLSSVNPGAAVPYHPESNRKNAENIEHDVTPNVSNWKTRASDVISVAPNGCAVGNVKKVNNVEDGKKLTEAAVAGDVAALRKLLKQDDVDVNSRDEQDNTALHCAAQCGKSKAIRYLLLHGADTDAHTRRGRSALQIAVDGGHTGTVGVLLDYMHSVDNRPRDPFVILRSRHEESGSFRVERLKNCAKLEPFKDRGHDHIHLLIAHGQRSTDMAVFLYSVLDVPVCHAFFLNTIGDLNMKNFQRFETKAESQSITVLNSHIPTLETKGYGHLRSLILVSCGLYKISLGGLASLQLLDLCHNQIQTLPSDIEQCSHLRTIRISHNNFRNLTDQMGKLKELCVLEASHNSLRRLTSHITQCLELKSLILDHNHLMVLPVDMGLLESLEELVVNDNKLASLPLSLSELPNLSTIHFHNNPLTNIPRDFPERVRDVKDYLSSLQDDPIPNKVVKLVMVGQEGVGKSTLLSALKRTFWLLPRKPSTPKTEGIDVNDIQIDDLTFKCFDCGGDVDFSETHRFFITPGALFLACFNLSEYTKATVERNSFLLGRLQLWLQYIFSKVPAARVIIVGTHADHESLTPPVFEEIWEQLRTLLVSARDHHRQYFRSCDHVSDCFLCQSDSKCLRRSIGDGAAGFVNLACDSSDCMEDETSFNEGPARVVSFPHIVGYYEVSSRRAVGNTSVFQVGTNKSIDHLKDAIVDVGKNLIRDNPEIPRKWANVYESLASYAQISQDNCASTFEEVARIAKVQGVHKPTEVVNMLHFLKAQGNLLFFPRSEELSDMVILDPEWLAKIFASVVSYRDTGIGNDGFLQQDKLKQMWKNVEPKMRERLLALLHYFGVCLPIGGTQLELFPSKLPLGDPPEHIWPVCPNLSQRQITYSVTFPSIIPPPFFSDLIIAVYRQHHTDHNSEQETCSYYSNIIVDSFKLDKLGCRDCEQGARGPPQYLDDEDSVHKVLFELISHKRCIQVTVRGEQPCCMMKSVNVLLNKVASKYEGLGAIELDTVVCLGCNLQRSKAPHRFSAKLLLLESSSRDPVKCSNGHVMPSSTGILLGNVSESCMPYMTVRPRSAADKQDYSGCPKLFVMLPVNCDGMALDENVMFTSSLLLDGFAVHLICEFPDGYHLTNTPGYRLRKPEQFMTRYGDHVVSVLRLLGHLSDSTVLSLTQFSKTKAISKTVNELVKDFRGRFKGLQRNPFELPPAELSREIHARGRMFRRQDLRNELHVMDRPDSFGPLRRLQLPEQTLWLCNEHFRQLRIVTVGLWDIKQLEEDSKA